MIPKIISPVGVLSFVGRLLLLCLLFTSSVLYSREHSKLWGRNGELWKPDGTLSKLLDFTNVGYRQGEVPIPNYPRGVNVRDFGAVGDGVRDDTQAFKDAIAACPENSAVIVPVGRYTITDQIRIGRNNIVLRGEDMYRSVIWFPKYLTELITFEPGVFPKELVAAAHDANGKPYAGRLLYEELEPHDKDGKPVEVKKGLMRLLRGQHPKNSGFFHLHDGSGMGIENLSFEFREQPKGGHWETIGADAIQYVKLKDSWVRNVSIKNADHAIRINGCKNASVLNIVLDQYILRSGGGGAVGHMGISLNDSHYCLVHQIELTGMWIHDIVTGGADGHNVYSRIKGTDLKLDHHSQGGQWQLHTEIDFGKGTRPFSSSQNDTYWGLRSLYPISYLAVGEEKKSKTPRPNVVVGMHTKDPSHFGETFWHETIDPNALQPSNLYLAQLQLKGKPLPEGPPPERPLPPPGADLQFTPVANALLRGGSLADKNFGGGGTLPVKPGGGEVLRESILRFDLSRAGVSHAEKATLRIYPTVVSTDFSLVIKEISDDNWLEYAITRNTSPAVGEVAATVDVGKANQWIEVDLTDLVNRELRGNKQVSILLAGAESKGASASFNSANNYNPPVLTLKPKVVPVEQ